MQGSLSELAIGEGMLARDNGSAFGGFRRHFKEGLMYGSG
ncbi:hypothetical protein D515_00238 [Grimontia indica]|uniref:Uncharacterized protein n=1 Tax=Grimontia indica TaxID=1056512 RepID=R1INT8_9GAMM|nr:hypothetical protein D515_00238 [Grimontia indica]